MSKVPGIQCNTGIPSMGVKCLSISRKCSELEADLLPFNLFFGKHQYQIPAQGYTITDPAYGVECMLAIDQYNYPEDAVSTPIILGDTFLRNFRTTFDFH